MAEAVLLGYQPSDKAFGQVYNPNTRHIYNGWLGWACIWIRYLLQACLPGSLMCTRSVWLCKVRMITSARGSNQVKSSVTRSIIRSKAMFWSLTAIITPEFHGQDDHADTERHRSTNQNRDLRDMFRRISDLIVSLYSLGAWQPGLFLILQDYLMRYSVISRCNCWHASWPIPAAGRQQRLRGVRGFPIFTTISGE